MFLNWFDKSIRYISTKRYWRLFIFALLLGLTTAILALPISLRPSPYSLTVGDVSFQDIRSSRSFSYVSAIRTQEEIEKIEKSISPVFLPADPEISRNQVSELKRLISAITNLRQNENLSTDTKIIKLTENYTISPQVAELSLNITDSEWENINQEALIVLEQIMRTSIREDQVINSQKIIPAFIGLEFSESQVNIIKELVSPFIVANSIYSNELTNEAIQAAKEKVTPVTNTYLAGETIVLSGQVITPEIYEALQALGLTQSNDQGFTFLPPLFLTITTLLIPALFFRQVKKNLYDNLKSLVPIILLFLFFLLTAKLFLSNHVILPYLFPIAAFGLTVSSMYDYETGIFTFIPLSFFTGFIITRNVELFLYFLIPGIIAIFVLGKGRRLISFFIAGLIIGVMGSMVIFTFHIVSDNLDWQNLGTLCGAAILNGLGSISLTLLFQYFFSIILGKPTALQLMDLLRPDQPLLQALLLKAPGTYQHSLQTANLAEQAAKEINCDPLLTRVGALYHDIGKMNNPDFFIENQEPGKLNTHNDISPQKSAKTIIKHVIDGVKIANAYNIPPQIINFISEHHGTSITRYQYSTAQMVTNDEKKIRLNDYRYPGPKPKTRETAIVMLADGCEARAKADQPKDEKEILKIVREMVDYYIQDNQLDNANVTLRDLKTIQLSLTSTLRNIYHKRIKYPNKHKEKSDKNNSPNRQTI